MHVLTTKLYPPPPRPYLVARPRLVERLNDGLQTGRKLILVSAAAGFGKTTLISEWIAESQLNGSVAWISLDEEDNHPTRFVLYLIAALQHIQPKLGKDLASVLQASQLPSWSEWVDQLINQIAVSEKSMLLVLDDYHLVTATEVHQIVQRIIERQPTRMHTVILTREDPPWPLPRMRVRRQVTEIRERDLRFTLPEAQSFLVEAMGLDLSTDDVGKLKERTEGWVAGMQLAALALEDFPNPDERRAFVDAFTGSDRYIIDYLVSEVLERQPEPIREFLMKTSLLERFCSECCDQVVYGNASAGQSQAMIENLEQGNMFLVPLDNQRRWYRYHHLFAEMLNHYLRRSARQQVPALYQRASRWFEGKGLTAEAVRYATAYSAATDDWNFVADLLNRHAMRMIFQGQGNLVMDWCQAFPQTYLEQSPEIAIYDAWALVLTFRTDFLDAVEEKLAWAMRAIQWADLTSAAHTGPNGALVPLRDWVTGQVCVIRSQILLGHFHAEVDPQELISLSLTGLELLPESEKAIRAICTINLAHAQLMQNRPAEARSALEKALPLMLEAENYLGGVTSIFYQARLAYYQGHLDRAEDLCRHWKDRLARMTGSSGNDLPAIRGLDIVLSILLLERGRFDEAEQLLGQALELPGWASWMEILGFITQARYRALRGDLYGAEEIFRRMENLGPQHASCAEALRLLLRLRTSPQDPQLRAKAETWAQTMAPDPDSFFALGIGPYHCDVEYFCHLTWARMQVALGHPQTALPFVKAALAGAQEHQLPFRQLELVLTQATIEEASGNAASALAHLQKALEIAEAHGYHYAFFEVMDINRLLQKALERNMHTEYVKQLLASPLLTLPKQKATLTGIPPETTPPETSDRGLIEPVSERELEVLRLIAGGFSNAQIATQLYITLGTVKRHIANLYGKLGVQSRTQAIARARELDLL